MDTLSKLGLITFIAQQMASLIYLVPESGRVYVAVVLILWVSAIAAAFLEYVVQGIGLMSLALSLPPQPCCLSLFNSVKPVICHLGLWCGPCR